MQPVLYIVVGVLSISLAGLGWYLIRTISESGKANKEKDELKSKASQLQGQIDSLTTKIKRSDDEIQFLHKEDKKRQEREKMDREHLLSAVSSREKIVAERTKTIEDKEKKLDELMKQQQQQLEKIAELKKEDAVKQLTESIRSDVDKEVAKILEKRREAINERSEDEARRVISMAIHRFASAHTVENTVSYVDVPSEDIKGKIIGREGRNIRALERETGVDIIIDDTPGSVTISAFDGVRREIARRSLERLIGDGRIHPARIEEIVEKTKQGMEKEISKIGETFLFENDIHNVHPKLITLVGRLKFRTSYGQNVLQHIAEVGHVSSVMAAELGLDAKLAKRCGIFHDIGKAVDHTFEGSHPEIGGYLLKRFNERDEVIEAAAGHHSDPSTVKHIYTVVIAAADAVSASRPGARGETGEGYVKRVERLEAIAKSFPGVNNAFCVYAGRELRVIVDANTTSDEKAAVVAQDIAKMIEDQLTYPGEIKVSLIREKRVISYAR